VPDNLTMPLVSATVTAEDAAPHDGTPDSRARLVAGDAALEGEPLRVRAANGLVFDVPAGWWVIRYGPGDAGVMSDGAFRRWFPCRG